VSTIVDGGKSHREGVKSLSSTPSTPKANRAPTNRVSFGIGRKEMNSKSLLGIGVHGGPQCMGHDWQENLDDIILSLTHMQEDIDRIPLSRSRILTETQQLLRNMNLEATQLRNMLEYIEDLGFEESDD
jgi:hypothetical protein